jgi:hypothetical protein
MKKKIKQIYYSGELPELTLPYGTKIGVCGLLGDYCEIQDYYKDYREIDSLNPFYLNTPGIWSEERLNLICLLIHSLELED